MDEFDRRLLRALQRDCTQPLEELGDAVGLSRNAVWRRIKALEASGVLRARVALLDGRALGLSLRVMMLIRTGQHGADWARRFSKAVRAMPEVTAAYRMTGDLDYLIEARVADMAGYDRLYQRLTSQVEMTDVSASFVMEVIAETTALPV